MNSSRHNLLPLLIMTSVVPLLVLGSFAMLAIQKLASREADSRINSSLTVASLVCQRALDRIRCAAVDFSRRTGALMEEEDQLDLLRNEAAGYCRDNGFDFLEVTDSRGVVIASASNEQAQGHDIGADRFVRRALEGRRSSSTEILENRELRRLGIGGQAGSGQALAFKTVVPVINHNEIIVGAMQVGIVMGNGIPVFLQEIRAQTGLEAGIFLGNRMVAATSGVFGDIDQRGNGLRTVLTLGREFTGPVTVSGKVLRAGYVPLMDSEGSVVGMLGLESPVPGILVPHARLAGLIVFLIVGASTASLAYGLRKGAEATAPAEEAVRKNASVRS